MKEILEIYSTAQRVFGLHPYTIGAVIIGNFLVLAVTEVVALIPVVTATILILVKIMESREEKFLEVLSKNSGIPSRIRGKTNLFSPGRN